MYDLLNGLKEVITVFLFSVEDWSAWITTGATVILTILTFVYVRLTSQILASQSDPCVVVSVIHDDTQNATLLKLVIKNIGNGLAHDIRFQLSKPIPIRAFGFEIRNKNDTEIMIDGPLINGIPALAPGDSRQIAWGQYGGLISFLGEEPVVVTCHFKKNNRKMKPIRCLLDVKSFAGTDATPHPTAQIIKELKNINKSIQDINRQRS